MNRGDFIRRYQFCHLLLVMLAVGCDGGKGTPTSPSQVWLMAVRVNGPTSVAPGDTAQYRAIAEYSDGSSKDVTAESSWTPENRAEFPIYFTSAGVAEAVKIGEQDIRIRYDGVNGVLRVFVLAPGTFRLSGTVLEPGRGMLDGVKVEVLSGIGTGLKTTTDFEGRYRLYGVAGSVQLRTSAEGFATEVRDVVVTGNDGSESFVLTPLAPPADISGTWTMTVTPSSGCRAGLPDIARVRTYEMQVVQQRMKFRWVISSPTLERAQSAQSNAVGNSVVGSRVRILIPGDTDEGEYTSPGIYDRVSENEWFGFSGSVEGTLSASEIRASLNGDLLYWVTGARDKFWYCRAKDHSVILQR